MLPDCSREYLLKKILGGACPQTPLATSRLRRSIGKFQFLWAKPNPMPDAMHCVVSHIMVNEGDRLIS